MRAVVVVLGLVAGCGFRVGAGTGAAGDAASTDAPGDSGGTIDTPVAMIDAPVDAGGECGGKRWVADFSTDPTQLDVNGDSIPDWIYRGGGAFPTAELSAGVWHIPSAGRPPLDTRPVNDFTTRTIIHGRMRGALPNNGAKGAVVYINVGFEDAGGGEWTYATLFVDAKRESNGTQTMSLWMLDEDGTEIRPATSSGQTDSFKDFTLDIDPVAMKVTYRTAAQSGTHSLIRRDPTSTKPNMLSVLGYSTAADHDFISVEVCP